MRTGVERLASARIRSEVAFCQSTVAEVSGTAGQEGLGLSAKATQFRMIRMMLFDRVHCLGEPVMSLFLVAQLRMCHGQQDIVEGRASLAEGYRAVEGGTRGFEVAGAIISGPQGVPVGATFGIRLGRFDGQRKSTSRVVDDRVGRVHQKPRQIVRAVTPLLVWPWATRLGHGQLGVEVKGMQPGGLCLDEPLLIFRGTSPSPVLSRQCFPGSPNQCGVVVVTRCPCPCAGRNEIE